MLAALMVFATVFSVLRTEMSMTQPEVLEIMRNSGLASTGLTFIWMPQLFARMLFGRPLAILFFLGLTFAGFSSLIAHLELSTRVLIDVGLKRSRAIVIVTAIIYLLGVPSAISLNFLKNQDFVWGYALIISGALAACVVTASVHANSARLIVLRGAIFLPQEVVVR
jgi:NSS family neurotransmitter:Na+ symporter